MILWDRVLANLRHAGMTQRDIAKAAGVSKRAVESWVSGVKQPREYRRVLKLLDLHLDRCPQRHRVDVIGEP